MTLIIKDIQYFTQRNSSMVALGVSVVFLIIVLVFASLNFVDKRNTKKNHYAPQNTSPKTQNASDQKIRSDVVTRANLFGDATPKVVVAAPTTTLNLTLKGILSADSPTFARAIIQADSKASQLYSIGDEIKGSGAKLEAIRPNEVLLNRSGAIESLPLIKVGNYRGAQIDFTSGSDTANLNPGSTSFAALSGVSSQGEGSNRSAQGDKARLNENAPNGPRRKIKRPSFSGIDRAIKKAEEI